MALQHPDSKAEDCACEINAPMGHASAEATKEEATASSPRPFQITRTTTIPVESIRSSAAFSTAPTDLPPHAHGVSAIVLHQVFLI